jgi:hypothetical protein
MYIYQEYTIDNNVVGRIYKEGHKFYGFSGTLYVVEGDLQTVVRELESFLQYKYKKPIDNSIKSC